MAKKKAKTKTKTVAKKAKKKIVTKKVSKKRLTSGLATLALILNVIFPGIGSLLGGRIKTGIFQIILMSSVVFFFPIAIGTVVWVGAVIWGIVTGVSMIQEAQ